MKLLEIQSSVRQDRSVSRALASKGTIVTVTLPAHTHISEVSHAVAQ
ncbi:MAG: hypothetical protein IGR90_15215 [Synechococcales cyanobacterium K32_A2020_035]|nr:hypothetical protein [Synechococcales cyanobacterium K32_A2020_035]